jgi:transposase
MAVYSCFNRWSKKGVWQQVLAELRREADDDSAMIDASVVRAHQQMKQETTTGNDTGNATWSNASLLSSSSSAG